jgi:hypothetical protein
LGVLAVLPEGNKKTGFSVQTKGEDNVPMSVELDKKKKLLTIRLPLEKPWPSASGKTMLIASTRGLKTGDATYSGHPVSVVANAFFYLTPSPPERSKSKAAAHALNKEVVSD